MVYIAKDGNNNISVVKQIVTDFMEKAGSDELIWKLYDVDIVPEEGTDFGNHFFGNYAIFIKSLLDKTPEVLLSNEEMRLLLDKTKSIVYGTISCLSNTDSMLMSISLLDGEFIEVTTF